MPAIKSLCFILFVLNVNLSLAQNDLNYYIHAAKENSPLIADNKNLSEANQLEAQRLKAFYTKPEIGVSAAYLFAPIISTTNGKTHFEPNSNGADKYYGYDLGATNGGQYQALLNVNQPLFNGGKYKTANEQLNISSQMNSNNTLLTAHDLEKIVTDQYILCLQDLQQISFADANVQLLSQQKEMVKKLAQNSVGKQSDVTLLNIEFKNALLQQNIWNTSYRKNLLDLNILCGINDTTFVQLKNIELTFSNFSNQSAFLKKYELDSLNLKAAQNVFELKYKPQLNFIANGGLNALYAPTIPYRFGLSAGINFTYNFFDGNQKNLNRSRTDVLLKSITAYRKNFLNQNEVRKTKIINELQSYTERISIAKQQLEEYDTLLNAYAKEIQTGELSVINYITALKNKNTAQRDYVLLFAEKQLLINAFNYWNW